MISEALLSEVLESQVDFICDGIVNESFIRFYLKFSNQILEINIYELAHKCKELAFEFNYNLCSSKRKNGGWECWTVFDDNADNLIGYFETLSEPESIFKACQWILDNKEASK